MVYKAKYKIRSVGIFNFLKSLNKPISRVDILRHFKKVERVFLFKKQNEDVYGIHEKETNTNERALRYLVENNKITKFCSNHGRVMYEASND